MGSFELGGLRVHEDPELFREAVSFTAAQTRFSPRLIEKDYFCSVLIAFLAWAEKSLTFKGGTCLAKVHAGFYRLSEDLDWHLPVPSGAKRSRRSALASGAKDALALLPRIVEGFRLEQPLTGANLSTQYVGATAFRSLLSGEAERIKINVSLREPLLEPATKGEARTLLLDPISGTEIASPVTVPCISKGEAYAEKLRAALARRDPAIRDFFDVDHALQTGLFALDDPHLVSMVRRKLDVAKDDPIDLSRARLDSLRRQVEARLRPVLRPEDFERFDLERAFSSVTRLAERIGGGR